MKHLRLANALGYVGLITVNALSIFGRLGPSNADVSAKFQTLITPTGSTFMIWGVIFLLQLMSVVMQVLPIGKTKLRDETVNAIGYCWILGWTAQCAWQFAFVREAKVLCAFFLTGALLAFTTASVRLLKLESSRRHQRPVTTAGASTGTDPASKEKQDEGSPKTGQVKMEWKTYCGPSGISTGSSSPSLSPAVLMMVCGHLPFFFQASDVF
eukprot:jgi/Pico_ML_1/54821/g683.t1